MGLDLPTLNRRRHIGGGSAPVPAFSPSTLYSSGSQGIWLDPSDLSTMFSDRAGTTPVTTPGTVVGVRLDKSKGLVLGSELVTNGTFDSGTTGWTAINASLSVVDGKLRVTNTGASNGYASFNLSALVAVGSTCRFAYSAFSGTTSPNIRVGRSANASDYFTTTFAGSANLLFQTATNTNLFVTLRVGSATAGEYADFDNISVRELAGNHAVAPTDAARPIYGVEPKGGRRNLLTYSEALNESVWGKAAATVPGTQYLAPDGTTTADAVFETTANTAHYVSQIVSWSAGAHTFSLRVKPNGRTWCFVNIYDGANNQGRYFNLSGAGAVGSEVDAGRATTATISAINDGFYLITVSRTLSASGSLSNITLGTASADGVGSYSGNTSLGILVWGAQLELGSTATNYQRVTNAYDVTESGVPTCHYVQYDGSDDSMSTSAIDFTATDKMSVFAGVRKLSTADSRIVELSVDPTSNAGAFWLSGPQNTYEAFSRGTAAIAANQLAIATGFVSPTINVVTSTHDIAGDLTTIRVNGAASASATGDKGTGNFGNYPMFFGRRNNATLPFNGRDFGIIIVGKAASAGEITDTELWLSDKTAEVDVAKSISPNIYTRSGDTILDRANSIIERRA